MGVQDASMTVTALNAGFEVIITQGFQADQNTWTSTDVFRPFVEVSSEDGQTDHVKSVDVYTKLGYPNGIPADASYGEIIPGQEIIFSELTNNKEYTITFQPQMGVNATQAIQYNRAPQAKPTPPILGAGEWTESPKKLKLTIDVNDVQATKMNLVVTKQSSGAEGKTTFTKSLDAAALNLIRTSGSYDFELEQTDICFNLVTNDVVTIKAKNFNETQMSNFANNTYTLATLPTKPATLTVEDVSYSELSGNDHGGPFARNGDLVATFKSPVGTAGSIDHFEITKHNSSTGLYDSIITTIDFDVAKGTQTDYKVAFKVPLGSVAKYGVRSVKGNLKSDITMTSGYVVEEYVNSAYGFVAEQIQTGFTTNNPSSSNSSFKLTFSNGVSSYINRDISSVLYTIDYADSSKTDVSANMTFHSNGTNGTWDVAADGTATMYGFTPILTHGDKVTFTIKSDQYRGYYNEHATTIGGKGEEVQFLNGSNKSLPEMTSNEIAIAFPLIKPNDPSNVVMIPNDGSVMVRWTRVATAGTGGNTNNKADKFAVRLYTHQGHALTDTPVLSTKFSEKDEEFVFFNGLNNNTEYWCTVQAVNDADVSKMIRSAAGATPLASILPQLLSVSVTNSDSSLNFVINMAQSAVDISNIYIQPITKEGANNGNPTLITVNSRTATTKLQTLGGSVGLNEFYVYAKSTAKNNDDSQQAVIASDTPFLYVQHTIAIAPTIDSGSASAFSKGGEGTNTDPYTKFSVNIDNQGSDLTLAKVVAIPAAPGDDEDLYTGDIVHDLIRGATVGNSTTNYKWSVNIPYHILSDISSVVMAASAFGNDQELV